MSALTQVFGFGALAAVAVAVAFKVIDEVVKPSADEAARAQNIGMQSLGQTCSTNSQCAASGHGGRGQQGGTQSSQIGCCGGRCATRLQDWSNSYVCGEECVGNLLGEKGSCRVPADNPDIEERFLTKAVGDRASSNYECSSDGLRGGPAVTSLTSEYGVCGGVCTQKKKDWTSIYWCPDACRASPLAEPGSCKEVIINLDENQTQDIPLDGDEVPQPLPAPPDPLDELQHPLGSTCDGSTACDTPNAVCDLGRCTLTKKDWAGIRFKPSECRGSPFSEPGTC